MFEKQESLGARNSKYVVFCFQATLPSKIIKKATGDMYSTPSGTRNTGFPPQEKFMLAHITLFLAVSYSPPKPLLPESV